MKSFKKTATWAVSGLIAALGVYAFAQTTLCAVVKLEIQQQATLEREGFDAHLAVSNNLPTTPLTGLKVQMFFKDANGNPADSLFFVKVATLTNVNAVDGTGVVQSSSTADIHWLIIPSTGAGGSSPAGQQYGVSAVITGVSNGITQTVTTFDAFITVQPQPLIKLEYVLPYEVFADEPLTAAIEPVEPFPLGLRVTNVGFGTANNFSINSAQPQIVDNKQGLQIDFKLLGTMVSSSTIPNTLLIPFGNVVPNGVSQAQWIMSTTLSGRFIGFTSTFTHAADLGGQLTSLLQGVTTYTLLHAGLVDLPGRDSTPDFLVNQTMDRGAMQTALDAGSQPPAQMILESDQPTPIPVTEVPGALTGSLGGVNASLTYTFGQAVSSSVWVHSYASFPYGTSGATLSYVRRGDGKVLNAKNAWVSKHFRKSDLTTLYWINIVDLTSTTNTYTMVFNAAVDPPPAAVADLSGVSASSGGTVNLSWTAPGEDGNVGNILGGRYFVEAATSATSALAPTFAQVNIATSTTPGNHEKLGVSNLLGNATYYFYQWTQDTGGNISGISNGATAYALPYPPAGIAFTAVGSTYTAANWSLGNNSLPILYSVAASTAAGGAAAVVSPNLDSLTTSYIFAGLSPNTTYYYRGNSLNSSTGVKSQVAQLGAVATLAVAPVPGSVIALGTASVRATWALGADPADTEFLVEISTTPDQIPPTYSSGWIRSSSYTFTGLAPQFVYSGRVKARNRIFVETAYAELGTAAFGYVISPALGPTGTAVTITGSNFGVYVASSTRVRFGANGPLGVTSLWTDSKIIATVPVLPSGSYTILIERQSGPALTSTPVGTFSVAAPSTGPALALTPFDGDAVNSATPLLVANYSDAGATISASGFHWSLDGVDITTRSAVTASSASFVGALADGAHTLAARVVDSAALTAATTSVFLVDTVAPATTLSANATDTFSLAATDAVSGVADTVYLLDVDPNSCDFSYFVSTAAAGTCANPYYGGAFTLVAGTHTVAFYSDDYAGNSEAYHHVALNVGHAAPPSLALAPVSGSTLTIVTPLIAATYSGPSLSTASVRLSLDGVNVTTSAVVTASSASYTPAAALSQGTHTVTAYVATVFGDSTTLSSAFFIDSLPPRTSLVVNGLTTSATSLTLLNTASLGFSASDSGVGVASTSYALDGGAQVVFSSTFSLSVGTHAIAYHSVDRAGNSEATQSVLLTVGNVDVAPPSLALSPVSGSTVTTATPQVAAVYGDLGSGINPASVRLTVDGVDVSSQAVVTTSSAVFAAALSQGSHTATALVADLAGNVSSATTRFFIDSLPPNTSFFINGLQTSATSFVLVSTDTVGFTATDAGTGVASIRYTLDAASETVYTSTFSLSAGAHILSYRSLDRAGNAEPVHVVAAFVQGVDATAPSLTLAPVNNSTTTTATPQVAAVYSDTGTGINLASVRLTLDGADVSAQAVITTSSAVFAAVLSQGSHTAMALVADLAGNVSSATTRFFIDSIPPNTSLLINGLQTSATSFVLVSTDTLGFSATDAGTGVASILYALDASTETVYTSTFSLTAGAHTLSYRSLDRAGNAEVSRQVALSVQAADVTPPSLTLSPVSGSTVTTVAPLIAAAYSDAGSGVNLSTLHLTLDGSDVTASAVVTASSASYAPASTLPQGNHTVAASISDRAGNAKSATAVWLVDTIAPVTALRVDGIATAARNLAIVSTDTIGLAATDSGTGVAQTLYALDAAPAATVYSAPFSLSSGTHTVAFYSVDVAGNREAVSVATVAVTAPVVSTTSAPTISRVIPSSAPIGGIFILAGANFGVYSATGSVVLFNSFAAAISTWTPKLILASVPGALPLGPARLVVQVGGVQSSSFTFTVVRPTILKIAPSAGPSRTGVVLTGTGFGQYAGAQTMVLLSSQSVPVSVWTDRRIVWTVPAGLPQKSFPVTVVRKPAGGSVASSSVTFTVTAALGVLNTAATLGAAVNASPALNAMPPWFFEGDLGLTAAEGGAIETPSYAKIQIPAGGLYEDTDVLMQLADRSKSREAALARDGLVPMGRAVDFGPAGLRTALPATIELPYVPSVEPDDYVGQTAIYCYDSGPRAWTRQSTWTDAARGVLGTRIGQLSVCQPLKSPVRNPTSGQH